MYFFEVDLTMGFFFFFFQLLVSICSFSHHCLTLQQACGQQNTKHIKKEQIVHFLSSDVDKCVFFRHFGLFLVDLLASYLQYC